MKSLIFGTIPFKAYLLVFATLLTLLGFGQKKLTHDNFERLTWSETQIAYSSETNEEEAHFFFPGIEQDRLNEFMPFFSSVKQSSVSELYEASLEVMQTESVTEAEKKYIDQTWKNIGNEFRVKNTSGIGRGIRFNQAAIEVFRKNNSGSYDKLTGYKIKWQLKPGKLNPIVQTASYASNSVLASGDWYKIGITQNGVYKLDRNFIASLGIDVSTIDPRNIKLYGNGGTRLNEKNSVSKYDDLIENAIKIVGESDGIFDASDYILFYGKGPNQWEYNPNHTNELKYLYDKNYYSDTAYYFLTVDNTAGKRISQQNSLTGMENYTTSTFDDFAYHELDLQNLIKSGREFYGENFDVTNSYSFGFSFPNIVAGDTMFIKAAVAGRNASAPTYFNMSLTDNQTLNFTCVAVGSNYTNPIADEDVRFARYVSYTPSSFSLTINKLTAASTGWFNYVRVNARRNLQYANNQLQFRDARTYAPGRISKFSIGSPNDIIIWDVTNHLNVEEQLYTNNGTENEFVNVTDTLREYVAFTISDVYTTATSFGKIANQNLHALNDNYDYIIITHPNFKSQALQLAQLHQEYDTLNYVIATPGEIYNEFSSGSRDITALREFVRMLYSRATKKPRYLLLFGDGSYVNKGNLSSNTNFIPTWQTENSLAYTVSKTSDDFYGLLDDTEGDAPGSDIVDIGIGRLPVKSTNEANSMVEKVKHYYLQQADLNQSTNACNNSSYSTFGDWRNWITFLADDAEAGNSASWELVFVQGHSEPFSLLVDSLDPTFNVDKIYLDAYQEYSTSGGQKYPDAEKALNNRIQKGCLILNYSGHGGELQLTSEAVVDVNTVSSWKNLNNLPMFVTATCEFSRFDDPARTSCGEDVLLNSQGGGICMFTTTRLAYSTDANALGPAFFKAALHQLNGWFPRTGDMIRITKQGTGKSYTHFTLLGDPAVTLAYPKLRVFTTEIDSKPVVANGNDTLKALTKITVKGYVGTKDSVKLTNFNGLVFPSVYDKPAHLATLGNDQGPSGIIHFDLQKSLLYKGKSDVINGDFQFTFIVPKDINYQFGNGKISYYAFNETIDAAGYYDRIIVGGSNPNAPIDNAGPEIQLYMNDDHFVFGGTTNNNPKIYMALFDSSGINTVGNGIGHDIVAVLDNDNAHPYVLNDYYEANTNSYQSGKLFFPLSGLSDGHHSIDVKVWDIQNNSSTAHTEFVVAADNELTLNHVLNYPNPFTTKTSFFVEHNQCCTDLDLQVQVFTISGKIVKTINSSIQNQGFRTEGIEWDGKDDFGDKLAAGVYIYRIKVKSLDGKSAEKLEKLVILN